MVSPFRELTMASTLSALKPAESFTGVTVYILVSLAGTKGPLQVFNDFRII